MKKLQQISSEPSLYQRTKLLETRNGTGIPNEITIQEEIVKTNACLIPNLIFFFLNDINKIIPIKKVIKLVYKNCTQSLFL